jgi:hypothetical protein
MVRDEGLETLILRGPAAVLTDPFQRTPPPELVVEPRVREMDEVAAALGLSVDLQPNHSSATAPKVTEARFGSA